MLVSTHKNGCTTRPAIYCPALTVAPWCQKLQGSFWLSVTLYLKKAGNQNLTKRSSGAARIVRCPTVSYLWQQSVCRLQMHSLTGVSFWLTPPRQRPSGIATGQGKAACLKNLTPQLTCKWQGLVLARDWTCSPLLPCARKSWLPALGKQAAQQHTPLPIHAGYLVSLASLCNCSDLNPRSRELM